MNIQTVLLPPEVASRPSRSAKPARRTQGERSAETRRKIISSSIELLHQIGYAGTTTSQIAKTAGVSLGALQHQYPTKAGLMAAVVRHFAIERFLGYRRALRGVPEGLPRFLALSKAAWSLIGTRELVAAMEIELAMRDDPELAAAIGDTLSRHSAFMRRLLARILDRVIGPDDPRVETVRLLNNAIISGLTLETIRTVSPAQIEKALAAWECALVTLIAV